MKPIRCASSIKVFLFMAECKKFVTENAPHYSRSMVTPLLPYMKGSQNRAGAFTCDNLLVLLVSRPLPSRVNLLFLFLHPERSVFRNHTNEGWQRSMKGGKSSGKNSRVNEVSALISRNELLLLDSAHSMNYDRHWWTLPLCILLLIKGVRIKHSATGSFINVRTKWT